MTAHYRNPWYSKQSLDPSIYSTDVKPIEYRGFLIYQRIKSVVFDVVKDHVCVAQHAGLNGAKGRIDTIIDNPTDFWAMRSLSILESNKVRELLGEMLKA